MNNIIDCVSMEELESEVGAIRQYSFYRDFESDAWEIVARFDDPEGGVYYRLSATQEEWEEHILNNPIEDDPTYDGIPF